MIRQVIHFSFILPSYYAVLCTQTLVNKFLSHVFCATCLCMHDVTIERARSLFFAYEGRKKINTSLKKKVEKVLTHKFKLINFHNQIFSLLKKNSVKSLFSSNQFLSLKTKWKFHGATSSDFSYSINLALVSFSHKGKVNKIDLKKKITVLQY